MRIMFLACVLATAACGNVVDSNTMVDAKAGTCGDSNQDPGEACDSGGVNTSACDKDCTLPVCGDGVFNSAVEECDDGNTTDDGNGCDNLCRKNAVCGDTIVQSFFEACDDGNQTGSDGCSADCKQAVVSLIPVSDRGGGDFNNDGVFDAMNQETSTGEAIAWVDPEQRRIAFEVDTRALRSTHMVQSAQFTFSKCCLSGQATVQLHGYFGNGAVELADFTQDGLITDFLAADMSPGSLDVKSFVQNVVDQQRPYAGFLLRLATLPTSLFNLGVQTSNNADPLLRPRLSLVYCVDADNNATCD